MSPPGRRVRGGLLLKNEPSPTPPVVGKTVFEVESSSYTMPDGGCSMLEHQAPISKLQFLPTGYVQFNHGLEKPSFFKPDFISGQDMNSFHNSPVL